MLISQKKEDCFVAKEKGKQIDFIRVDQSLELHGEVSLSGAKNAVLVIMVSLILTEGKSILKNVPDSADVQHMILVLKDLGAQIQFDVPNNILCIDTTFIRRHKVSPEIMKKMRASILVMGPLLARFCKADIALPGGCLIGPRPVDLHIKNLKKMGVCCEIVGDILHAHVDRLKSAHLVLEYPSVGATENIIMAAVLTQGETIIINAALEPEVIDLICVLKKMGANIEIEAPCTIKIKGVSKLHSIIHEVMPDRLEAGALLLAAAITGGSLLLPTANYQHLEVFLLKLEEMGHTVSIGKQGRGIIFTATKNPKSVSFRTAPYPGFPTDLQAPMIAALTVCEGKSVVHETVFENRFLHVRELQKMGAQIKIEGNYAHIAGIDELYGTDVIATDIRASCALVLAGLVAKGTTKIAGIHHWKRGYEALDKKLALLGAQIILQAADQVG